MRCCLEHCSDMYEVRLGQSECPFCQLRAVKQKVAAMQAVVDAWKFGLGGWMSAALDDDKVCAEMKADIYKMFDAIDALEVSDD